MEESKNKGTLNQIKSKCIFNKLKSDSFLEKTFNNLQKMKLLEIVKYNNHTKQRLNLTIYDYKKYCETYSSIEIEITPIKNKYGKFIHIDNGEQLYYYHIYFNNNKEKEIKRNYLNEEDNVSIITIIIDYQIKSLDYLFFECNCIESINFKKFYRNNIKSMSYMCEECSSLKEINLSNFNTDNVKDMSFMFYGCWSLKEINLSNFNTGNVKDISFMFYGCTSLKEINLSNFNIDNVTDMNGMFSRCSNEIKTKIKSQIKNIKQEAFENIDF